MNPAVAPVRADSAPPPVVAWYVWITVLSVACAIFGVQWDIAWHRSIGRDTFWSPPHDDLSGRGTGGAIVRLPDPDDDLWPQRRRAGHRADLGFPRPAQGFITAWGGIAMLASAPFDNWWHDTYGLDVKIMSPPHAVLALGLLGLQLPGR